MVTFWNVWIIFIIVSCKVVSAAGKSGTHFLPLRKVMTEV